uniref:Lipoprotein n=1 Tax=Clostridioides difficile TaxID=1496 RepID=A0A381I4Q9_CLODI|nr:lipoprotein [Clostridioides difficile]
MGSHPHVIQGIEKYKNKYIAYSLGNFCFGGNKNPSDTDSYIYQQTFTFSDNKLTSIKEPNIIPTSITSSKLQK